MEFINLTPDNSTSNVFTVEDDLKWQPKIKALKDGKKVKISIAEITCSVVNQDKAAQELSEDTFSKVHKLYYRLNKLTKQMVLNINGYKKIADRILIMFDDIADMRTYMNCTTNIILKTSMNSINYKFRGGWLTFFMFFTTLIFSSIVSIATGDYFRNGGALKWVFIGVWVWRAKKSFYKSLVSTPTQNRLWKIYGKYTLLFIITYIVFVFIWSYFWAYFFYTNY